MRVVSRLTAMAIGLVGSVIAFVVNAMYSLLHLLGRISGVSTDRSHFFIGTGLTIVAVIGSVCVGSGAPEAGAVLLVLATVGFFFIMGWWAVIPAIFLVAAAVLAIMGREEYRHPTHGLPTG
jgi:hypothetical protein